MKLIVLVIFELNAIALMPNLVAAVAPEASPPLKKAADNVCVAEKPKKFINWSEEVHAKIARTNRNHQNRHQAGRTGRFLALSPLSPIFLKFVGVDVEKMFVEKMILPYLEPRLKQHFTPEETPIGNIPTYLLGLQLLQTILLWLLLL